jgi:MtrB/PioB family decaheme-associated outer membrane protein
MKPQLSIIAMLLMSASSQAEMFDFGVTASNAVNANISKWQCKKCISNKNISGDMTLSAGTSISDDDQHSLNALAYDDGAAVGVDADIVTRSENGIRTEISANKLGSEYGDADMVVRKTGLWKADLSYDSKAKVDSTTAQSDLVFNNETYAVQPQLLDQQLKLEREKLGFLAKYTGLNFGGYVNFTSEDKTGTKRSSMSMSTYTATNFVKPVDSQTQILKAAVNLKGDRWLAEVGYSASQFENDINAFTLPGVNTPVQADSPDNSAYSVFFSGRYRFDKTSISGRFTTGEHKQDESLVTLIGAPTDVNAADLSIITTNANLAIVSRLTPKITLRGSVVYRDRDNDSSLYQFDQVVLDNLTGQLESTQAIDYTNTAYKLSSNYRINSEQKLSAGLAYKEVERSFSDREKTDDSEIWLKYHLSALKMWDMRFKAAYSERDGSTYQAVRETSTEDNVLMRKYYLADRDRTEFVAEVSHTPLENLSIDVRGYYAKDNYTESLIGLTESEDYGYDANANLRLTAMIDVTVYGGYQWIDNDQLGSQLASGQASWAANTIDEFGFVGMSAQYTGLADLGWLFSAEYVFSYNESDTVTSGSGYLGLYKSESNSVELKASYALNDHTDIGLKYQYEDYEDSDYADIAVINLPGDGVTNLTSLGYLSQDYDAHLIQATINYHF